MSLTSQGSSAGPSRTQAQGINCLKFQEMGTTFDCCHQTQVLNNIPACPEDFSASDSISPSHRPGRVESLPKKNEHLGLKVQALISQMSSSWKTLFPKESKSFLVGLSRLRTKLTLSSVIRLVPCWRRRRDLPCVSAPPACPDSCLGEGRWSERWIWTLPGQSSLLSLEWVTPSSTCKTRFPFSYTKACEHGYVVTSIFTAISFHQPGACWVPATSG